MVPAIWDGEEDLVLFLCNSDSYPKISYLAVYSVSANTIVKCKIKGSKFLRPDFLWSASELVPDVIAYAINADDE